MNEGGCERSACDNHASEICKMAERFKATGASAGTAVDIAYKVWCQTLDFAYRARRDQVEDNLRRSKT